MEKKKTGIGISNISTISTVPFLFLISVDNLHICILNIIWFSCGSPTDGGKILGNSTEWEHCSMGNRENGGRTEENIIPVNQLARGLLVQNSLRKILLE